MSRGSNLTDVFRHIVLVFTIIAALPGCSADTSFLSGAEGTPLPANQMSSTTSGGNGDYYGGKPSPGTYQRFDATTVIERLRITEDSAELMTIDTATKLTSLKTIHFNEIEFAAYFPGHVGVGDGLYTKTPLLVSEGASEAWCRKPGSTSQVGYDVSIGKTVQEQFYRANFSKTMFAKGVCIGEQTAVVEGVVQDRSSIDRVRYRASGFELEIRFDTFNSVSGKFQGRLKFDQDAQVDTPIECRIGGALDSQLPPNQI